MDEINDKKVVAVYKAFTSPLEAFNYAKQRGKNPKEYHDYWILGEKIVNEEKWEVKGQRKKSFSEWNSKKREKYEKLGKEVVKLLNNGDDIKAIADILGVSEAFVYATMKRNNIQLNKPTDIPKELREKIYRMYKSGMLKYDIYKVTGVSLKKINGVLRHFGKIKTLDKTAKKRLVKELYKKGVNKTKIVYEVGLPMKEINKILER